MISEKQFINNFSSFWRLKLPLCDDFVRYVNKTHHISVNEPYGGFTYPNRRALINEISFLFMKEDGLKLENVELYLSNDVLLKKYEGIALKKVARIMSMGHDYPLLDFEKREAVELAALSKSFFLKYHPGQEWRFSPRFRGCGLLSGCEGDMIIGRTLYEIKAADRPIRMIDIKQLIVYCMLDYSSSSIVGIDNVAVFNPRTGTLFKISVDELAINVSGKYAVDLYGEIIDFISSSGVSK